MKKLVYICSPLRGDYDINIDNATEYSRAAFVKGYIPITPHIYFTRFLNDDNERERCMAMDAGLQLMLMCSEVWVFGLDHPSEGMQVEIAHAIRHGIPIRDGMAVISGKAIEHQPNADGFVSLKDTITNVGAHWCPLKHQSSTSQEGGKACQNIATMKATRILPHSKR